MIAPQRRIHRLVWLLLAPLLLALVVYFSAPGTDLTPANPALTTIPGADAGKGSLP